MNFLLQRPLINAGHEDSHCHCLLILRPVYKLSYFSFCKMIPWIITLLVFGLSASSTEAAHHHLNDTCIDLKFKELEDQFEQVFGDISQIPNYEFAQEVGHVHDALDHEKVVFDVSVRWSRADDGKRRTYARMFHLTSDGGQLVNVNEGALRVMDGMQLMDSHSKTGSSAILFINQNGEQYLTVNTSNAQTSCTLRLNMYGNIHGKVMTDDIFGALKFSPDGK